MSDDLPIPTSEPDSVEMLAAALRADAGDLEAYERVLANSLSQVLPEGMLEIVRDRSMADRLAGRSGKVVAIKAYMGDATLELKTGHGGLKASAARAVRGVTISSKPVTLEEWTRLFAEHLHAIAQQSAQARAALGRFLHAEGEV